MKDWIWLGRQQHSFDDKRVTFSLATYLPESKVLVSTVGFPIGMFNEGFETYVFQCTGQWNDLGYPTWLNPAELEEQRYYTSKDATEGHMALCRKYEAEPHEIRL